MVVVCARADSYQHDVQVHLVHSGSSANTCVVCSVWRTLRTCMHEAWSAPPLIVIAPVAHLDALAVVLFACPAGTPADKLLQMLTDLLDGTLPNLQDILLIQSSILEARDIYQPWRLGKQLLETKDLEVSSAAYFVQLLSYCPDAVFCTSAGNVCCRPCIPALGLCCCPGLSVRCWGLEGLCRPVLKLC